jgi:uncharacterized protein HemX
MTTSEWIKTHWPVVIALVAGGTAWGQQQQKIDGLTQAIAQQQQQGQKIEQVKEQAIRNEEQLKAIQVQLADQQRYLRALVDANPRARGNL